MLSRANSESKLAAGAVAVGLIVIVFAVYWPVRTFDFVRFDDPEYVWNNPIVRQGLTGEGVEWAFKTDHLSNWHPLTWLSHMLDVELFGVKPGGQPQPGPHLVNVGLHAINAVLLLLLLRMMTGLLWPGALVAALFALHPLRVESVAWVSERKDVLSTLFGLLAIMAYVAWTRHGGVWRYGVLLLCFAASLMSKPMFVTLPCVLLLLDFWPLNRLGSEAGADGSASAETKSPRIPSILTLVLEKVPLFAVAGISSVITFFVQRAGGAVVDVERLPLAARAGNAAVSCWRYLFKTFWPADLTYHYSHPVWWPTWQVIVAVLGLVIVTSVAILFARRRPYLIVGWLWFLGMLVPVIGLVQVGKQAMADRYMYVPQVGVLIMMVWGLFSVSRSLLTSRAMRVVVTIISVSVLTALCVRTRAQVMVWRDTESLCMHALLVDPQDADAHHLLGRLYMSRREHQRAYEELMLAARLGLGHAELQSDLGDALALMGRSAEAIEAYERALAAQPDRVGTLNNYACILATHPDAKFRDGNKAAALATRACELTQFKDPDRLFTLAAAYAEQSRFDLAVKTAEQARDLAMATGKNALAAQINERLVQFRNGQPSRMMFVDPESAR